MYNKSKIFKTAWNLVKATGATLANALKSAWAAAKINMEDIKSVRIWENYGKVRLYVQVAGVSEYQHRKGTMYVEFSNGVATRGNSSVPATFVASLQGLALEAIKGALK